MQKNDEIKKRVVALRARGKTYAEIRRTIGINVSKSSLSYWCKGVILPPQYHNRVLDIVRNNMRKNRLRAVKVNRRKYIQRLEDVRKKFKYLKKLIYRREMSLVILASLYLGEGTKGKRGCITFGNSNPQIISIFLKLLRECFNPDEAKFRCTVQGRADMNIPTAMRYWSRVTGISMTQFYSPRIDSRTIGKKSIKMDYRGVCRVDYLSADVFHSLMAIGEIICGRETPLISK